MLVETMVWALPASTVKNRLLCRFGHHIDKSASVGLLLVVGLRHANLAPGTAIRSFTTIRGLALLDMRKDAMIGSFNWISAHPLYQTMFEGAGTLAMREGAAMTSRHYIDCSGTVELGYYTVLAGHRTTILTHEASLHDTVQNVGRVSLGARSAVFTNSVMLTGAHVPPWSIVGANSTVMAQSTQGGEPGLYGGSPAKRIGNTKFGSDSSLGRAEIGIYEARMIEPLGVQDDPLLEDHAP